ncbi:hypothetical protein VP01_735g1 [Puccinia sorghi]|uniref:Uncharacterized protein n=1 Tax=Puccinia sorghi TaxID=27349 RepID=A0A0L6UCM4_9BASI|nr:hypothetical protein VP01_735g1 [Puccinia sorghi]
MHQTLQETDYFYIAIIQSEMSHVEQLGLNLNDETRKPRTRLCNPLFPTPVVFHPIVLSFSFILIQISIKIPTPLSVDWCAIVLSSLVRLRRVLTQLLLPQVLCVLRPLNLITAHAAFLETVTVRAVLTSGAHLFGRAHLSLILRLRQAVLKHVNCMKFQLHLRHNSLDRSPLPQRPDRVFFGLKCRLPSRLVSQPDALRHIHKWIPQALAALAFLPSGANLSSVNSISPIFAYCKAGSRIGVPEGSARRRSAYPGHHPGWSHQLPVMHAVEDDLATDIALPTDAIPDRMTGELEVIPDIGLHIVACGSPGRLTAVRSTRLHTSENDRRTGRPGTMIGMGSLSITKYLTYRSDWYRSHLHWPVPHSKSMCTSKTLPMEWQLTIGRCCLRWAWVVAHGGACKRGSCRAASRS